jgi:hypothetical protein
MTARGTLLWRGEGVRLFEVECDKSDGRAYYEHRPGYRLRFERLWGEDLLGVEAWKDLNENDGDSLRLSLYALARAIERQRPFITVLPKQEAP